MFRATLSTNRPKATIQRWLLTLWILLFAFCQPVLAAGAPLRIDYPDFWPFFTQKDNGEMTGFFYEIVTEALNRMDIEAAWQVYPWGRCQEHLRNGRIDGIITVPTPARLQYSNTHADPFYLKNLTVFTYPNNSKQKAIKAITSIDDILAADLTVITYMGNGWNDKNIRARGIKTYETPKLPNVWRMLAHRRGDIAIEWPGAAWPDIYKAGLEKRIEQTDVTLQSMPFHLLIGKTSPYVEILPAFNQTILEMKEDGTIDAIINEYIVRSPSSSP